MALPSQHWSSRLPFYYGWLIVGVAFVTMAIGVTGRTAFSLLMPPLIEEFSWDRGLAAGAFSFGFLVSAVLSPIVGRVMDTRGPRMVIMTGVALMSVGLLLAPWVASPWHLYATLGVAVGGGANMMTYTAHSQFLPNWFVRRRGFAISIAFSGVGVGAIVLLPWLQCIILSQGWRASCGPWDCSFSLSFTPTQSCWCGRDPTKSACSPDGASIGGFGSGEAKPRRRRSGLGCRSIGRSRAPSAPAASGGSWSATFCALVAWYAVQVHQTKYLVEIGFTPLVAAWALGMA